MMDKAESPGVTYVCEASAQSGTICNNNGAQNVFAYVYPTSTTPVIYMCSMTLTYNPTSERIQTVIHELSHFNNIGDTDDVAYGEPACKNLAGYSSSDAATNADSVGYYL